ISTHLTSKRVARLTITPGCPREPAATANCEALGRSGQRRTQTRGPGGDGMDEARMTQQAMATWGRLAQSEIAGDLAAFAALGLGEGERLSAIAGLAA